MRGMLVERIFYSAHEVVEDRVIDLYRWCESAQGGARRMKAIVDGRARFSLSLHETLRFCGFRRCRWNIFLESCEF